MAFIFSNGPIAGIREEGGKKPREEDEVAAKKQNKTKTKQMNEAKKNRAEKERKKKQSQLCLRPHKIFVHSKMYIGA